MAVGVGRRLVADVVSEEREEGVDVFGLVVAPDRRIVGLPAGGVHVPPAGFEDALRGPQLGVAELRVENRVGGLEDQVRIDGLVHEVHARGVLLRDVGTQRLLSGPEGLEHRVEGQRFALPELERPVTQEVAPDDVRPVDALRGIGRHHLRKLGNRDAERRCADVAQRVALAHQRKGPRGEDPPRHLDAGRRTAVARRTDVHHPDGPAAADRQRPVDRERVDAFVLQHKAVDAQQRRNVRSHAVHQACVRVVGHRAQHGEHQRTLPAERAVVVDAPAEDEGHLLAAHFDVVVVGKRRGVGRPDNAMFTGGNRPALGGGRAAGKQQNGRQKELFDHGSGLKV